MASNYQNQYEAQSTEEYQNVSQRDTDQYGNPVHRPSGGDTTGAYGTTGGGPVAAGRRGQEQHKEGGGLSGTLHSSGGATTGAYGTTGGAPLAAGHRGQEHNKEGGGLSGTLRRSGSGSSSSEDDGEGGRRKKTGLKEKTKEKLPGHNAEQSPESATTVPYDVRGGEDKGMMEKIKEKLPGYRA